MASSTNGQAAPVPHKTRGSVSPKATSGRVPVGAAATSAASAAPAASAGLVTQAALPLRPPLQAALDDFARELRKALDKVQADIAALREQLMQSCVSATNRTTTATNARPLAVAVTNGWNCAFCKAISTARQPAASRNTASGRMARAPPTHPWSN